VPLLGLTLVNTGVTVMFEVAPSAMPVALACAMICVVPDPMVAAVDTVPPVLAAFVPVWAYVNVEPVPTPVMLNTPLNDVFVTPPMPTISPGVSVEATDAVAVTVTTLLDREIELIENVVGLTLVPLLGIVSVDGRDSTFAVFGVRLNVVELFIRIWAALGDVCLTVNGRPGPVVVDGKLTNCHVDCSTLTPTVTGR